MNTEHEALLVRDTDAAKMLAIARSTFWQGVRKKLLPQPVKIGGATRWRVSDLQQHIAASSTTTP
jgi:predicted DNA-binding transcriptional regulator AlpA